MQVCVYCSTVKKLLRATHQHNITMTLTKTDNRKPQTSDTPPTRTACVYTQCSAASQKPPRYFASVDPRGSIAYWEPTTLRGEGTDMSGCDRL